MEVIKISPERLMVTLSDTDMEKYSVDLERPESSTHTRAALRQILEDANMGSGFCMESARVLVQVFPSKKGGCEMFVTRLSDDETPVSVPGTGRATHKSSTFYSFDSVQNLLAACAAIYITGYNGESSAYSENGRKRYFLKLYDEFPNLSEFGGVKCGGTASAYVDEHCRSICNDAVKKLSPLA